MDQRLEKLATLRGIAPGYHDVFGNWRATSEEGYRAVLAAMGVDAVDFDAAIAAEESSRDRKSVV